MSTSKRKLKSVARRVARDPRRSPLFHWLLENYADLEAATAGARSDWAPLRAEAIENGITDDGGNEPSERTIRETMCKVRREVARRRAAAGRGAVPEFQPSRLPPTWRPMPVQPPHAPVAPRTAPPPVPAPAAPPEMNDAARAMLASLQEQLDYADRHVRPPKRKA